MSKSKIFLISSLIISLTLLSFFFIRLRKNKQITKPISQEEQMIIPKISCPQGRVKLCTSNKCSCVDEKLIKNMDNLSAEDKEEIVEKAIQEDKDSQIFDNTEELDAGNGETDSQSTSRREEDSSQEDSQKIDQDSSLENVSQGEESNQSQDSENQIVANQELQLEPVIIKSNIDFAAREAEIEAQKVQAEETKNNNKIYSLAKSSQDPSKCASISVPYTRNLCYKLIAIDLSDSKVCDSIDSEEIKIDCQDYIIFNKAKEKKNLKTCTQIQTSLKSSCIYQIMGANNFQEEACDVLDGDNKKTCLDYFKEGEQD